MDKDRSKSKKGAQRLLIERRRSDSDAGGAEAGREGDVLLRVSGTAMIKKATVEIMKTVGGSIKRPTC